MNYKEMTAPCGIACWPCSLHKENITAELAENVSKTIGVPADEVPCDGCRSAKGCSFSSAISKDGCKTKNCAEEKNVHNCSECKEFPCENLMPVLDRADSVPHNTKLYNLCRIKLVGIEAWVKEVNDIQQKYFQGKFVYGQAPELDKKQ